MRLTENCDLSAKAHSTVYYGPVPTVRPFIAFDKEYLHNAVTINNFGLCIHGHKFDLPPAEKLFRGDIIQGE